MTLLINGMGLGVFSSLKAGAPPLAINTGCQIGLDTWYITFTGLCGVKLLIQVLRYMYIRTNQKDSTLVHLFGNFIMMPLLFAVFFVYT